MCFLIEEIISLNVKPGGENSKHSGPVREVDFIRGNISILEIGHSCFLRTERVERIDFFKAMMQESAGRFRDEDRRFQALHFL
jgi:hypothetical protein